MVTTLTKNGFLVTLKGVDTYWVTCSGVKDRAQTSDHSDGLSNRVYQRIGPRKLEPITLTKEFDPIKDAPILDWWRTYCDGTTKSETMSIVPIKYCPKVETIGKGFTLYGCRPVELNGPEADKKSADAAMLEIVLIADDWEYN
jgi:hypothetical protein